MSSLSLSHTIHVINCDRNDLTLNPITNVGYGGEEIPVENFEYLSGRERYFSWVPASDGNIVDGAVWTGDENGEMVDDKHLHSLTFE